MPTIKYVCDRCGEEVEIYCFIHEKNFHLCNECYTGYAFIRYNHQLAMDLALTNYMEEENNADD
jgi:predicted nucleic acid-binding Zn ribbon protein